MDGVPESARLIEALKYGSSFLDNIVVNESGTPRPSPELVTSADATLTAFAQLAAVRLDVTRALVSLFDQKYQYVVAEATRNSPLAASAHLVGHDEGLWACGTAFPRPSGACEHVLPLAPTPVMDDPTRTELPVLVVPNLHEDDRFSTKAYCPPWFYAGVPIQTPQGINIGVFSVFDDRPRPSLDATSLQILRDLSNATMDHLSSVRARVNYNRSRRMVRGIGSFMEGKASISGWKSGSSGPEFENRPEQEGTLNAKQQDIQDREGRGRGLDDSSALDMRSTRMPSPVPIGNPEADSSNSATIYPASGADSTRPPASASLGSIPSTKLTASTAGLDWEFVYLRRIFSKAANILRESIEVEGVVFVDASVHSFGGLYRKGRSGESDSSNSGSGEDDDRHRSSPETTDDVHCPVLGFSTSDASSVDNDPATSYQVDVPEQLLVKLLRRYPEGKIFNFDENGLIQARGYSSDEDGARRIAEGGLPSNDANRGSLNALPRNSKRKFPRRDESSAIIGIFPGARSVALVPVWDAQKQKWFAGGFVYTRKPMRVFTVEGELSYLRAFGIVAMNEVAQVDTLMTNKSKSDVLNSLSHELRSPLHGLLLGAELLSDMNLNLFQSNLLHTIETCGRTLLDTVDHLLDYSKINNFIKSPKRRRNSGHGRGLSQDRVGTIQDGMANLSMDTHLDLVVEEVIDSLYLGYSFQRISPSQLEEEASAEHKYAHTLRRLESVHPTDNATRPGGTKYTEEDVSILVDIDPSCSWYFHTQPGAVRRILMNLFGNSLKYTEKGYIKVSLHQDGAKHLHGRPGGHGYGRHRVRLVVEDTGKGISDNYLQTLLFRPFSQEDHLSPGTGIGLSLVKRITIALGGEVELQSRLGLGTRVSVTIPMVPAVFESSLPSNPGFEDDFASRIVQLGGLRVRLDGFDAVGNSDGQQPSLASKDHERLIVSLCRDWLRMTVFTAQDQRDFVPDLVLCTEAAFQKHNAGNWSKQNPPTVTLCHTVLGARRLTNSFARTHGGIYEFISQPTGPRKLAKVLLLCFNRWAEVQPDLSVIEGAPEVSSHVGEELDISSPGHKTGKGRDGSQSDNVTPSASSHGAEILDVPERPRTASTNAHLIKEGVDTEDFSKPNPASDDHKSSGEEGRGKLPPSTFLLVDDNSVNLQILAAYMKKLEYAYTTAVNGKEAYDEYTKSPSRIRCILMDLSMPVMNGFQSSRLIRTFEQEQHLPPTAIIALTGLASANAQKEAFASGIDLFLTKPIRFKELSKILSQRGL